MNDTRIEPSLQKAFPAGPVSPDDAQGGVAPAPLTDPPAEAGQGGAQPAAAAAVAGASASAALPGAQAAGMPAAAAGVTPAGTAAARAGAAHTVTPAVVPAGASAVAGQSPSGGPSTVPSTSVPPSNTEQALQRPAAVPGGMRVERGLHNVPPPGARIARPVRLPTSAHGSLPPGGRRAKIAGAGSPAHAAATEAAAARPLGQRSKGDPQSSELHAAGKGAAASERRDADESTGRNFAGGPIGAAAGAAVWSARQGGAEKPASAWATPVGATTHPEFKPTPSSADAWPADSEAPPQSTARIRNPVLWGIILLIGAALAVIALWIMRSVATERDLAALARFAHIPAPPSAQAPPRIAEQGVPSAGKPETLASPPPAAGASAPATNAATPIAAGAPISAAPGSDQSPDAAAPPGVPDFPRTAQATQAQPAVPVRQQNRQAYTPARKPPSQSARSAAAQQEMGDTDVRLSPRARESLYSRVFKRCPPPGASGALQCRKHICNGAAGRTPACYHINRLNP
jgi:hypothetical protein